MFRNTIVVAVLAALASGGVRAQDAPLPDLPDWGLRPSMGDSISTPPGDDVAPPPSPNQNESRQVTPADCQGRAGLYAGNGLKIWVVRTGSLTWENPLRPLTPEKTLVLQVSVNGRLGTAYGPDHEHLRQGASTRWLEEETGGSVRWEDGNRSLPSAIRVVAEDGTVLLGPLEWQSCGDAPRASEPAAGARSSSQAPRPSTPRSEPSRPRSNLPQGAIPEQRR